MRLTRRERVRLLLHTYRDAVSPGRNPSDIRGAFASKAPTRTELWHQGSYYELGKALDSLKAPCPKIYRHTIAFFMDQEKWARKSTAEIGVQALMKLMPRNIFVPQEISENAGFTPGEAKAAARWRDAA